MSNDRRMPAEIDLDLDAEQLLGVIAADVLERLWPGFVPQDRNVAAGEVEILLSTTYLPGSALGAPASQRSK